MVFKAHRAERNRNLRRALSTAALARVSGILLQVISLPIAAVALGPEDFSVYSMIGAVLAWVSLSNLGISQATTLHIAREFDDEVRVKVLSASLVFVAIITTLVILTGFGLFYWTPVLDLVFGGHVSKVETLYMPLLFSSLVFLLTQYLSVLEAGQLAVQKQASYNVAVAIGTAVAALSVYLVSETNVAVLGVLVAVYLPVILARTVNARKVFVYFGVNLKHLFSVRLKDIRRLLNDGLSFVSGGPIGNFLCHPLSILLVGSFSNSSITASFTAVMSAVILAASVFSFLITPFRGAIPEANRRNDFRWIKKMYYSMLLVNLAYSLVPFFIFSFFGDLLFNVWYQGAVTPHYLILSGAGIYMVVLAIEVVNYNFISSLGYVRLASRWLLFKSVVTAFVVWSIAQSGNPEYIFLAMFVINIVFSVLPLSKIAMVVFREKFHISGLVSE